MCIYTLRRLGLFGLENRQSVLKYRYVFNGVLQGLWQGCPL